MLKSITRATTILLEKYDYHKAKLLAITACVNYGGMIENLNQEDYNMVDKYCNKPRHPDANTFALPLEIMAIISERLLFDAVIHLQAHKHDDVWELLKALTRYLSTNWQISTEFFKQKHMAIIYEALLHRAYTPQYYAFETFMDIIVANSPETFNWLFNKGYICYEDLSMTGLFVYLDDLDAAIDKIDHKYWSTDEWNSLVKSIVKSGVSGKSLEKIHDKFGRYLSVFSQCSSEAAKYGNLEQLIFFMDHGYPFIIPLIFANIYTSSRFDTHCQPVIKWLADHIHGMNKRIVADIYSRKYLNIMQSRVLMTRFSAIGFDGLLTLMEIDSQLLFDYLQTKHFDKYLALLLLHTRRGDTNEHTIAYLLKRINKAIKNKRPIKCPMCWIAKNPYLSHRIMSAVLIPTETLCTKHNGNLKIDHSR
jgi:hypothetical protein